MKKLVIKSPFRLAKKEISNKKAWVIRITCILLAFLLSGIICTILSPGNFGTFFAKIFTGNFSTDKRIMNLLCCVSTYLLLSLAVTPAFKMKFWNIGVEGQALIGCILSAVVLLLMPKEVSDPLVIILALICAIGGGIIWALIPTFFKIKFNTNETLFTLMMNYIATALAAFVVAKCTLGGSQTFPPISDSRTIISVGSIKYIPFVICSVVLTIGMYLYLNKAKHGFELSILGNSRNTARYIGIKINKVTIRTMALSGGIAGLVGFLLVCGQNQTLTDTLVGGRGFTAVLISWLGHFEPSQIAIYSFLFGFLDKGTSYTASVINISDTYFSGIIIGLFIIVTIISEFFVRYDVKSTFGNSSVKREKAKVYSKIKDTEKEILTYKDDKFNKENLFDIFCKTDVIQDGINWKVNRQKIKLAKNEYLNTLNNSGNQDENAKKIIEEKKQIYNELRTNYRINKLVYCKQPKLQYAIVEANKIRVIKWISNIIDKQIEKYKSDNLFLSGEKLKVFIDNLELTNWTLNTDLSFRLLNTLFKNYVKTRKSINKKFKNDIVLGNDEIKNLYRSYFELLTLKCDIQISKFIKKMKKKFIKNIKAINKKNEGIDK